MFRTMLGISAFLVAGVLLLIGIYTVPAASVWWLVLWIVLGIGAAVFYWVERHALRSRIAALISLALYVLGWLGLAASMRHWFAMPGWVDGGVSSVLIMAGLILAFAAHDGDITETPDNAEQDPSKN